MNKRTRQLIDTAHQFAMDTIEYGDNFGDIMHQRLVEMVVSECIQVIDNERGHLPEDEEHWTEEDHGYNMACSSAINMIKYHFRYK